MKNYLEKPFKEWDRKTPVYSESFDKYFFSVDELSDFCYDDEITDDENGTVLKLLICEPNYLSEIDFNNVWCELVPENFDRIEDVASKDLLDIMDKFNKIVKNHAPVSWYPGEYRTI